MRSTHARALAASAIFSMVGGSLAMMGTAQAAVMVSGSVIDPTGNYVAGSIDVLTTDGAFVTSVDFTDGTFDIPLADGTYKLDFSGFDYASEWYRDKADQATADVVTVAGAAQTLAPWTVDRRPNVVGVVRTADGRPVRNGSVRAYDATTGNLITSDNTDRNGSFRITPYTPVAAVKLYFTGYDPDSGEELAAEWLSDKATLATADPVAPTAAGADVGVVTLAPGGSVAGRVTSDAGAPLQRALVCVTGATCDYTDANGAYLVKGVSTGEHEVRFTDPIGEYADEYWNNIAVSGTPTPVTVAPGQAVTGIDAALAALPVTPPNGVDLSGTVRDQLGGLGVGYVVSVWDTPADPRDAKVVATTQSNRGGQYQFSGLDRVGGETEFKISVADVQDGFGESPREEGDFARRAIWSGDKVGYDTAAVVTAAAPRTLDFVQPVAGGVSGTVTSEAAPGKPEGAQVVLRDVDQALGGQAYASDFSLDGSYDVRTIWPGEYTVQFGASYHVPEWWNDTTADKATTITVRPGQMTTGISASLTKLVKAVERPAVEGNAWVGKTLEVDKGRWNTEADSKFTVEWLAGSTVVATGETLKVTKSMLGDKLSARVTNDAGFAQGQAVTAATAKIGYQPKLKAKVSAKRIAMTLKVKPLKSKKVKASVVVYEVRGTKGNGEPKLKKLAKATIKKGVGTATLKKALGKGKHQLVFRIKGKGKVGSGDLLKTVKIKR